VKICVYGSSSPELDEVFYEEAFKLGREMALRGHSLIFGGGERGLMGACVRGLESEGGKALGVAPRFFDRPGILHQECDRFIFTDDMSERKNIMEREADAFIAVPGGLGTFEELLQALTLNQLSQMDKPVAILNTDGYYDALTALIDQAIDRKFAGGSVREIFGVFGDTEGLLNYLEAKYEEK
jgi:uncharacterized protein (TIGR00730 family)